MFEIETGSRILIWRTYGPVIAQLLAALPGVAIQRIQCHDPIATCHILQGERISSAILKIVFRRLYFCFSNAVWALAIGYFRIVFDTLVSGDMQGQNNKWRPLIPQLLLADKFLHGYLYLYGKYLPAYQILTSQLEQFRRYVGGPIIKSGGC